MLEIIGNVLFGIIMLFFVIATFYFPPMNRVVAFFKRQYRKD